MKEAIFYKKLKNGLVQCTACNRYCTIEEGKVGNCCVRKNIGGKLFSLVYGKTLTFTVDPVEKKPLFHFRPGTHCLSISTFGCNFHCLQCQNFGISQQPSEQSINETAETTPKEIVESAIASGADGIAYTYTEPTIFAEYAFDTMKLAKKNGLYNVWVSNGYMTKEVIDAIAPFLDAINIDLKGNVRFYKEVCGNADIEKVMENIRYFSKKKIRQEITYLIIPDLNDNYADINSAANFVSSVGKTIPLHFSRFFPMHKMQNFQETPIRTLEKAKKIADETGLLFVYLGNTGSEENTLCPKCKNVLISRIVYSIAFPGLDEKAKCKNCGYKTQILLQAKK